MSSTKVQPTGGPGAQGAVPSLADCIPLSSLAAGVAGGDELHPRRFTSRRGKPGSPGAHSHPHGQAPEAGQEESYR